MSAIRPDLPVPTKMPTAPSAGMRSAQAAFFQAALAQAGATPQAGATTPQNPSSSRASIDDRPMRPGSLLDIKV